MARYPSFPPIIGARIKLRLPRHDDVVCLMNAINDRDVVANLAHVPYPYTEYMAQEFIENTYQKIHSRTAFHLFIENRQSRDFVGGIGWDMDDGEIGYWISKNFWRQGYATEALQLAVDYCRSQKMRSNLSAVVAEDHLPSRRVVEKCGFLLTGYEIKQFPARGRLQRAALYTLNLENAPCAV